MRWVYHIFCFFVLFNEFWMLVRATHSISNEYEIIFFSFATNIVLYSQYKSRITLFADRQHSTFFFSFSVSHCFILPFVVDRKSNVYQNDKIFLSFFFYKITRTKEDWNLENIEYVSKWSIPFYQNICSLE